MPLAPVHFGSLTVEIGHDGFSIAHVYGFNDQKDTVRINNHPPVTPRHVDVGSFPEKPERIRDKVVLALHECPKEYFAYPMTQQDELEKMRGRVKKALIGADYYGQIDYNSPQALKQAIIHNLKKLKKPFNYKSSGFGPGIKIYRRKGDPGFLMHTDRYLVLTPNSFNTRYFTAIV
jgi:hypothetical protein